MSMISKIVPSVFSSFSKHGTDTADTNLGTVFIKRQSGGAGVRYDILRVCIVFIIVAYHDSTRRSVFTISKLAVQSSIYHMCIPSVMVMMDHT